jgi:hypothetical protein
MYAFLRRIVEWRAKRKAAQVVIFDGAAEVEKTGAFAKGAITGIFATVVVFSLTAPSSLDPALAEEVTRREALLVESNLRAEQAMRVADVCLSTAQNLERTLSSYQAFLGNRAPSGLAEIPMSATN